LSDGSRPYVQPARHKNRKLNFGYVIIDGVKSKHEEGVYTLCFRRDGQPVYETIANPADAEVELAKKSDIERQQGALRSVEPRQGGKAYLHRTTGQA
jgi:hypothetical protein